MEAEKREIREAPSGDVLFNEYFDLSINRFSVARADDPACLQLDGQDRNPCIEERVTPNADLTNGRLHTITYDLEGNLWYSVNTALGSIGDRSTLGYLTHDTLEMVNLLNHRARISTQSTPGHPKGEGRTTGNLRDCISSEYTSVRELPCSLRLKLPVMIDALSIRST